MQRKGFVLFVGLLMTLALAAPGAAAEGIGPLGAASAGVAATDDVVGTAFTYQGRLVDGGALANGDYDFQFTLYDALTDGNQVGSAVVQTITVTEGYFTTQLDFGAVFNGDARYLAIEVRSAGSVDPYTLLVPRQALTPSPYALALPGLWTQQNATSPNLVGGYKENVVTTGVVGATIAGGGAVGQLNTVEANYGTVSGGAINHATGRAATTSGGWGDTASGEYSVVAGGYGNLSSGKGSVVSGGMENQAKNEGATIGGGWANLIEPWYATIGGGRENNIAPDTAEGATIAGGWANTVSGKYATVAGGLSNQASGNGATISGGQSIQATGQWASVGGGQDNAAGGDHATVGGGAINHATETGATIGGGTWNRANGKYATVAGGGAAGAGNEASGEGASVGGGMANTAGGAKATVAGGQQNTANGEMAAVVGGFGSVATGDGSTVGGGTNNNASGKNAAIAGGELNAAGGNWSSVSGGSGNQATAAYATVPGGFQAHAAAYGQVAHAAGAFSVAGDAQASVYVLRKTTTDATPLMLALEGGGERLTIVPGRSMAFQILVVGRSDGGASAGYWIRGLIENSGGATAFVGAPTVTILGEDVMSWSVAVSANDTADSLDITATGAAGTTVRWVATVHTAEVAW